MRKLKVIIVFVLLLVLFSWVINAYIVAKSNKYIFRSPDKVPPVEAVIILGASVYRSGELSPILRQRVEMGIRYVLFNDSVDILFSGHSVPNGYNEPEAMAEFARKRMVPEEKLKLDPKGSSTYTSMFNCKYVFNYRSILIVTQKYHLPRALYIARSMGMDANGLVAPDSYPAVSRKASFREFSSRLKDFFLLNIFRLFRK
ncbi:MAG: YdcF family protein [Fibrobacteria bacterium]|nr:YdcF family protein [Fibrobacteria bacterium]